MRLTIFYDVINSLVLNAGLIVKSEEQFGDDVSRDVHVDPQESLTAATLAVKRDQTSEDDEEAERYIYYIILRCLSLCQ